MSTPKQSHSVHRATITGLLGRIEYLVKCHADGEQLTWGHVGDLVYVKDKLTDIVVFLEDVFLEGVE